MGSALRALCGFRGLGFRVRGSSLWRCPKGFLLRSEIVGVEFRVRVWGCSRYTGLYSGTFGEVLRRSSIEFMVYSL